MVSIGQPRVETAFVGTGTAGEILGMSPGNVAKTLVRRGIEKQVLKFGRREMAVYLRADVERVARERAAETNRRAADERRRTTARGKTNPSN